MKKIIQWITEEELEGIYTSEYWNDIEKAKTIGYSELEKNLWSPVTGSTEGEDKKIFKEIYSFFKSGDYVSADSILFKELYLNSRLNWRCLYFT